MSTNQEKIREKEKAIDELQGMVEEQERAL